MHIWTKLSHFHQPLLLCPLSQLYLSYSLGIRLKKNLSSLRAAFWSTFLRVLCHLSSNWSQTQHANRMTMPHHKSGVPSYSAHRCPPPAKRLQTTRLDHK